MYIECIYYDKYMHMYMYMYIDYTITSICPLYYGIMLWQPHELFSFFIIIIISRSPQGTQSCISKMTMYLFSTVNMTCMNLLLTKHSVQDLLSVKFPKH